MSAASRVGPEEKWLVLKILSRNMLHISENKNNYLKETAMIDDHTNRCFFHSKTQMDSPFVFNFPHL
jgi:hypothetical protein